MLLGYGEGITGERRRKVGEELGMVPVLEGQGPGPRHPPTSMAFSSCFSLPWTWWLVLLDRLSRVPFLVIWLLGSH